MSTGTLLLHVCCAPCASGVLEPLLADGWQVTALWYNPNIHPSAEHKRREKAFLGYAKTVDLPVIRPFDYDFRKYLRRIVYREQVRCMLCYRLRLERTAQLASAGRYDAFATTLMLSPYQDHEQLRAAGEAVSSERNVGFLYNDYRNRFQNTMESARNSGFYLQNYCGCIFSEAESR
ncbi:MAG: epoxyqueuosine reductase QueH [Gemmatimonadota bacterium]|nr:epoxyqueuosine reductase QueH [Gemmatimonadota bacterium]